MADSKPTLDIIDPKRWPTNNWPMEGYGTLINLYECSRDKIIEALIRERQARIELERLTGHEQRIW